MGDTANDTANDTAIARVGLPTEPGLYLFAGRRHLHGDEFRNPSIELVRVRQVGVGGVESLQYIGLDFFWEPEKAVGVWTRVDEAPLLAAGDEQLNLARARALPGIFARRDGWGSGTMGEDFLLSQLGVASYATEANKERGRGFLAWCLGRGFLARDGTGRWSLGGVRA